MCEPAGCHSSTGRATSRPETSNTVTRTWPDLGSVYSIVATPPSGWTGAAVSPVSNAILLGETHFVTAARPDGDQSACPSSIPFVSVSFVIAQVATSHTATSPFASDLSTAGARANSPTTL